MSIRVFAQFYREVKCNYTSFLKWERKVWHMEKFMELNKETANRLWVQQFGKRQKTMDFSGREIAKAAYNDRNSAYGWNVDHILPQSRGGKTADYNLICCHILTNDEKADRFPCFKANEKQFEIQRRQNHYEIMAKDADPEEEGEETVNFLDAAQGLKCWRQCKPRNEKAFAGYVKVKVETANEAASEPAVLFDRYGKFLTELFGTDSIFAESNSIGYFNRCYMYGNNRICIFTVAVGNIPTKEDTRNLLDDCIILNTYSHYFVQKRMFESIQIACGMKCYDSRLEMALRYKEDIVDKKVQFTGSLMIDELVKDNTKAEKELKGAISSTGFYPYNFIFTKLEEDLTKRI